MSQQFRAAMTTQLLVSVHSSADARWRQMWCMNFKWVSQYWAHEANSQFGWRKNAFNQWCSQCHHNACHTAQQTHSKSKKFFTPIVFSQFSLTACLPCFDTVGWASGRASGLSPKCPALKNLDYRNPKCVAEITAWPAISHRLAYSTCRNIVHFLRWLVGVEFNAPLDTI